MALVYFTRPPSGATLAPVLPTWCANMTICRRSLPLLMKTGRRMRRQLRPPRRQAYAWFQETSPNPGRIRALQDILRIPRAPQVANFETQVFLPTVWERPENWGPSKGSPSLKRSDRSPATRTPSLTRRIETLS
ncbi:hypothetical protein TcCL_NonESM11854 [Trypanosoma cruzi]|nr:hypothetical protein TcCL_NonESM11854 [Trypanosoma cruzi]